MVDATKPSIHKGPVDDKTVKEMLKKQGINSLAELVKRGVAAARAGQAGGTGHPMEWWALVSNKWFCIGPGDVSNK